VRRDPRRAGTLVVFVSSLLAAATPAAKCADASAELDEVVVRGELPGPAMWKVSKGSHTLWIMGTISPMPRHMTWRQQRAEEVIRASGEVLGPSRSRLDVNVGLRESFGLLRQMLRLRHNADGSTLREVLPGPVYERWRAAHRRWFGKDPNPKERARPVYAAILLFQRALERSGLTTDPVVWQAAERIAKRHGVRVREREFRIEVDDPRGMLEELRDLPVEREAACLMDVMDYIDAEMPNMKRRAEAWATGDLATLRRLPQVRPGPACMSLARGTQAEALNRREQERLREDWSGIVDWLLLAHQTSFTTLPVEQLLDPDGVLAQLRRKGYLVDEPAGATPP
jgi:uncharacterized protein YbaP (TraB family)